MMSVKLVLTILIIASITEINGQISFTSSPQCPKANGQVFNVRGFTSSPFIIIPFQDTFKNPVQAVPKAKNCRTDGHCILTFEYDIVETQIRAFDRIIPLCALKSPTWFLTYNGTVPASTFRIPVGYETHVRVNNKIQSVFFPPEEPCIRDPNRFGRPVSVHNHGMQSLAPFDGWADDETCTNETKDYVYPNSDARTGFYHDHAIDVTADNAYYGMVGMYITTDKKSDISCGQPYNLDTVEQKIMILSDKLIDSACQLKLDKVGVHQRDFYGDINTVSGIPFPLMPIEPIWYRFRFLDASVSRPYLLMIKDENLITISQSICQVIATDGGYRPFPVPFPANGLLIGVAERYEVVCDFTKYAGRTLYWWNGDNNSQIKDVPYFCLSNYLVKMTVGPATVVPSTSIFIETKLPTEILINRVLTTAEVATAQTMVNNRQFHRQFRFERKGGRWMINGQTWNTFKLGSEDVGINTWQIWKLQTGGGWFHPVHLHLVDLFIMRRDGSAGGVEAAEKLSPKDVVYLGPSNTLYILARFGAHKGDYMFHCHNLIHQDNEMLISFRVDDIDQRFSNNIGSASRFNSNPFLKILYDSFKYQNPVIGELSAQPTSNVDPLLTFSKKALDLNFYSIFYPLPFDEAVSTAAGFINPWKFIKCP